MTDLTNDVQHRVALFNAERVAERLRLEQEVRNMAARLRRGQARSDGYEILFDALCAMLCSKRICPYEFVDAEYSCCYDVNKSACWIDALVNSGLVDRDDVEGVL